MEVDGKDGALGSWIVHPHEYLMTDSHEHHTSR